MRSSFFLWALRKAMRFSSRVYRPLSPRRFYRIAFEERLKIHDVVLEGIDLALRRRGYLSIEDLKAGKKR
jgi:hypothetical protein